MLNEEQLKALRAAYSFATITAYATEQELIARMYHYIIHTQLTVHLTTTEIQEFLDQKKNKDSSIDKK